MTSHDPSAGIPDGAAQAPRGRRSPKIRDRHLDRLAVVYIRQSSPQQVLDHKESRERQYELVDVARRRGFTNVEVIDDDLGRTASGAVDRPGFNRLVAALCAGEVGAVLCLDASRLSRNGRDWHHLLELCGRRLHVVYNGRYPRPVYRCDTPNLQLGR